MQLYHRLQSKSSLEAEALKKCGLYLKDRFFSFTRFDFFFQMKCDFLNIKKGTEFVDQYLERIKDSGDRLYAAGDLGCSFLASQNGLPTEFNVVKTIITGKKRTLSLKELRAQLKAEEARIIELKSQ